ncbi:MAG TPA: GspE/PulE family protein [Pirellulaceae bacterium]|nr:GspE/PulE family protein [Pirellulaceae bacterium]
MQSSDQVTTADLLDMDQVKVDPRWALRIPASLAQRRQLLPFAKISQHVLVACRDASDVQGLQAVERYVQAEILPQPAEPASLDRAIQRIFADALAGGNPSAPLRAAIQARVSNEEVEGEEIVALSHELFFAARIRQATDIHLEPGDHEARVRMRVDGVLEEYRRIPLSVHQPLISRFKVLAGMDIAERRAPQDGRFTVGGDSGQAVDVRAATIPTKRGERLTLRLLASQAQDLSLDKLGMTPTHWTAFANALQQPNGLIMLTGPTGCGKSTTLYAAIRHLMSLRPLNIITIEDPVEYAIDGVSQVEVDAADKVSFHKALRAVLRHDPDVLMIGEIRDAETAEIVVKASLTGHLVLTSLHTNSALNSVNRLVDMGIKPFLIGAISRLYVAQRLVRRLCAHCRSSRPLGETEALALGQPERVGQTVFFPTGCRYCAGTGFAGRTGLFELLPFDAQLARWVHRNQDELSLREHLIEDGWTTMLDDAWTKLSDGTTTPAEVIHVVSV